MFSDGELKLKEVTSLNIMLLASAGLGYLNFCLQWGMKLIFMLSLVIYIETQGHFLMLEHKYVSPSTFQAANQGFLLSSSLLPPREYSRFLCGLTLAEA